MLPQPWLWGGGISYRYAVESDLFPSMLRYPAMACAVTNTQTPLGFSSSIRDSLAGEPGLWNGCQGGPHFADSGH